MPAPRSIPALAIALALFLVSTASAQCTPHWLPGFAAPGADNSVTTAAVAPDGDVFVGGFFTAVGSVPAAGIARFRPGTGQWSALGGGVNGTVYAIAFVPAASGTGFDVLVGGQFSRAAGGLARNIARYNPATSQWSALGPGCNDVVYAFTPLPGGDMLVGGAFTLAGGQECGRLARYSPATGAWAAAGGDGISHAQSSYAFVYALAPLPSGDIMVGGDFDTAGTITSIAMARYTPSTEAWSFAGAEAGYTVRALGVLPDGNVFAGGTHNGSGASSMGVYNVANAAWTSRYSTLTLSGIGYGYSSVSAVAVVGNSVLAGGNFSSVGTLEVYGIARLNLTSGTWSSLNSNLIFNNGAYPAAVSAIVHPPGGDVHVCGGFTYTRGGAAFNLARIDEAGAWHPLADGTSAAPQSILPIGNGDAIVGGDFRSIGGVHAEYVAVYNVLTRTWSPLGTGVTGPVVAAAKLPDGRVWLATRTITLSAQGLASLYLADPATGFIADLNLGQPGSINDVLTLPGGDAVVIGSFATLGGVTVNNIARVSAATGAVTPLGSGLNADAFSIAPIPGGDILVAGRFTAAGGVPAIRLARYSFASGAWTAVDPPNNTVNTLAADGHGNIYAGGSFSAAGSVAAPYIARWNTATQQWSPVGSGVNGAVFALSIGPDGSLVAGGAFTLAGGAPAAYIARYDPAADRWSPLGSGVNANVYHVAQVTPSETLAIGSFGIAGGTVSRTFAHFSTRAVCAADFNCSGALSPQDLFDYLGAWFAHDPAADLLGDGLSERDIMQFIALWFHGC